MLYRLADASVSAPALTGRYDIRSETYSQTDAPGYVVKRTLVVDTRTGARLTYETPDRFNSAAPPVLRVEPEPTETAAFYAGLPTDSAALRARLLTDSGQAPAASPTEDEFVYSVATDMLMSPVVPPALRAALYRVLAGCHDVTTDAHATDPDGRPAIEITQTDNSAPMSTYEDPATGAVLAQSYMTGEIGVVDWEVYEPVRSADTIPANPYSNETGHRQQ